MRFCVVNQVISAFVADNEEEAKLVADEIRAAIARHVDMPDTLAFEVETVSIYPDDKNED